MWPNDPPPAGAGESLNANQLAVLSEFSGKDSEDIENFCLQVKRCKEAFGWSQHATSQMVQTKLTGAASTWLRSLIKMAPREDSLDEWEVWDGLDLVPGKGLKHFLLLRFREGMNEKGAVAAVADLNQGAHESVDAFYDRVVLAMDRKNFRTSDVAKETEAYKAQLCTDTYTFFAAGLNEDIRKLVLGVPNPPTEIMGLHAAARNAEREIRKSKPSSSINEVSEDPTDMASPPVPPPPTGVATMDLAELKTALVAAVKSTARRSPSKNITCWRCNCVGHMSYQCRVAPSFRGQPRGQGPSRGRNRGRGWSPRYRGGGPLRHFFQLSHDLTPSAWDRPEPYNWPHYYDQSYENQAAFSQDEWSFSPNGQ